MACKVKVLLTDRRTKVRSHRMCCVAVPHGAERRRNTIQRDASGVNELLAHVGSSNQHHEITQGL